MPFVTPTRRRTTRRSYGGAIQRLTTWTAVMLFVVVAVSAGYW